MSKPSEILQRPGTMGWLVLSAAEPDPRLAPQLLDRLLERIDPGRSVVALEMAPGLPEGDDLAAQVAQLLGQPCTRLALEPDNVETIQLAWLDAGLIFTRGGVEQEWRDWLDNHLFQGYPEEILAEGSLLFAAGPCAGALGTWIGGESGANEPGLGWLNGGIICPGIDQPVEIPAIVDQLESAEPLYALGLGVGAVMALGPTEEREVWSERAPVIVLGKGWLAEQ
jgi:hypothetical protein